VVKLGQVLNQHLHLSAKSGNVSHVEAELGAIRYHCSPITERDLVLAPDLNHRNGVSADEDTAVAAIVLLGNCHFVRDKAGWGGSKDE
jgi:hypothetical protein